MHTYYPTDAAEVGKLSEPQRSELATWMSEMDDEHQRRGFPYGDGPLASVTGIECWLPYFEDGYSPSAAFDEDLSHG